jgi:hypothetical protein
MMMMMMKIVMMMVFLSSLPSSDQRLQDSEAVRLMTVSVIVHA